MEQLGRAIGSLGVVLVIPMVICWFALSVSLPFLCWSITRNLSRTRRAAERIADALDSSHTKGPGGVLGI
jgi:hypothetical protein